MNMPGFDAEASLSRTNQHYRFVAGRTVGAYGQAVIAQRIKLVTWTCDCDIDICVCKSEWGIRVINTWTGGTLR